MLYLGVKIKKWVPVLGFLLLSPNVFAQDLIIPEICVSRAAEIGIFKDNNPNTFRNKLKGQNAGQQIYDFEKISNAYQTTLNDIKNQMEDYKSPLFRYLENCRGSPKSCHGYFQPTDRFHQRIFCDREIFQSVIESTVSSKKIKFDKCVEEPFDSIELSEVQINPDIRFNRSCFERTQIDGILILKNKSGKLIEEIKWLFGWFNKMKTMTLTAIKKSLVPEGTRYILAKTAEEFQDIQLRQSKINDLNSYYNTLELAKEFNDCCKDKNLRMEESKISNSYLIGTGSLIGDNVIEPDALVFKTEDMLSDYVFRQAEEQYWRDQIKNKSPLELSPTQKYQYFAYLQSNPFFLDTTRTTFNQFVQQSKDKKRSDFKYRLPTDAEFEDYMDKYKKQRGYVAPQKFQALTNSGGTDPKVISNNFVFDYRYSQNYLYDLNSQNEKIQKQRFNDLKKTTYYPGIFRGFLPYQFARTAQANIIRELQKMPESSAKEILKNTETFHTWADKLTCKQGMSFNYCSMSQTFFRKKKHAQLYDKIISGALPMEYTASTRKYIYSATFVADINKKIKEINKHCWQYANPGAFKKDPNAFTEQIHKLNDKMESFYATPRFEQILGHSDFADTFEFKPSEYVSKCFTKGYLFGDEGYLSPSAEAATSTPSGYAAMGTIPVYTNQASYVSSRTIQEAYVPSRFQIKKADIEDIEEDIEDKISEEYRTLLKAFYFKSYGEYEEFLHESASIRIFALIDYAIDHPSKEIGKYICNMIQESDSSEYSKMVQREMLTNIALTTVSVMALFTMPIGGVTMIIFDASATLVATGIAAGSALYEIQYYSHKKDLNNLSVVTGNRQPKDALNLNEFYDQNISQAEIALMIDVGLFIVVGARPVFKAKNIVSQMLDKEYNLIRKTRQMELEEMVGQSAGRIELNLNRNIEDFIFNYKKVTDAEFRLYKSAIARGEGNQFIRANWKNLEKYVPKEIDLVTKSWRQKWVETLNKIANNPAFKVPYEAVDKQYSIFIKPHWFRMKPYINQWFLNFFNSSYSNEKRMVSFLTRAKELEKQTGRVVFTPDEINAFASKMKFFAIDNSGNFYRIAERELKDVLDRLMLYVVDSQDTHLIRSWLEPIVNGELLNPEEWKTLIGIFNRKITSIEDCKSFLKVVKFAKKDYAGLRAQITNARELANPREFLYPSAYAARTNGILSKFNELYDIAKYTRNKNNLRSIKLIAKYMKRTGKSLDDIEEELKLTDPPEHLKDAFNVNDEIRGLLKQTDLTDDLNRNIDEFELTRMDLLRDVGDTVEAQAMKVWKDPLKFEKQFLQQEKKYNDIFINKLTKNFGKTDGLSKAYAKALIKTQLQKKAEYECSLPSSAIRIASDRHYQKLAKQIALGTNFMGYWANHSDEEKTLEWGGRFTYEVMVSYFGGNLQSKIFTTKGGGPMYKTFYDLLSGASISGFDSLIYRQVDKTFWNQKSKFQKEFAKIIYESDDPESTIKNFFEKNPQVEAKILEHFQKIQQIFDNAELKNSKGTMVDSDLEQLFMKAGLIDDVVYSDMDLKNKEIGKDYIYNELIDNDYIDPDLFRSDVPDSELQDQLYALLAEINYEDLYNHKSGEIRYPFTDPINIGDTDAFEIHSGNEALDRFLFHISYDAAKTPIAYPKNMLVYKILCNGRFLPGNTNVYMALGVHLIYKATMDPLKFYLREQATGH